MMSARESERSQLDAHYETRIHRGEDMYEVGGFVVHFFDPEGNEDEIVPCSDGRVPTRLYRQYRSVLSFAFAAAVVCAACSTVPPPHDHFALRFFTADRFFAVR
jgi:hypothetical protein